MFPFGSNYPIRGQTPVTWVIIALCGGVALLQLLQDPPFADITFLRFGTIPALVSFDLVPWNRDSPYILLTMVTSMFVHAGVLHVLGNMLFFHSFSQPVESLMGPWRYALFYLLCGVGGTLGHSLANPGDFRPLVGASGAVAGVLAAHAVLLPWTRIRLPPSLLGPETWPAWGFFVAWAGLQFVQGLDSDSGIAWMAHIGGVVTGLLLAPLFSKPGVLVMAPTPGTDDAAEHGQGYRLSTAASAGLAVLLVAGFGGWMLELQRNPKPGDLASAKGVIAAERLWGLALPRDPESGLALYREAAQSDRYAALRLGKILHDGKLVSRDQAEAVQWYKRAADAGLQEAIALYAAALVDGDTVPRDTDKGLAMLRELAGKGYRPAELPLARAMERGDGGSVDLAAAAEVYRKGCDAHPRALDERAAANGGCLRWALMLFAGRGVAADPAQARTLIERLARDEFPPAQNALGLLIAMGDPEAADIDDHRRPDDLQAEGWFLKAAYAGEPDAMYNAARYDENRPNALAMPDAAKRKWIEKSAAAGNAKAKAWLQSH